jgi:hypothetical protein
MGKREEKKLDAEGRPREGKPREGKPRKREKKKKEGGPRRGIVEVLACPPVARFHYELVVGNGIGAEAIEDAQEAFKRAWEARREKAQDAAGRRPEAHVKDCEVAEHRVVGPFSSAQDWRIDGDTEPMTAMTWCWVGYQSITFFKPA